jgi:hypothetical protein
MTRSICMDNRRGSLPSAARAFVLFREVTEKVNYCEDKFYINLTASLQAVLRFQ